MSTFGSVCLKQTGVCFVRRCDNGGVSEEDENEQRADYQLINDPSEQVY